MTTIAQDGYEVPLTLKRQSELLTDVTVEGGILRLRKGDVACVLGGLFQALNAIERPLWPGCWSFDVRPIRGQTSGYTNHAAGCAFDRSAPWHGRQSFDRHLGWSASDVAYIHHLLKLLDGVVRWGGDYVDAPYDPMHFEIVGTPAAVARVAAKVRAGILPGQKGTTVDVPVFKDFTKPQKIPGGGIPHLLYVDDGTTHLSWLYGAAHPHGRILVTGTGTPGDLVEFDPALYTPRGKSYALVAGLGVDTALIGADGLFHLVYPIDLDIPAKQGLRPQIAATRPITVTAVRARLWKEAA